MYARRFDGVKNVRNGKKAAENGLSIKLHGNDPVRDENAQNPIFTV